MPETMEKRIKPGDTILWSRNPTGKTWVVSYADYENDALSPCGWPEGRVKLSECTLVKSCTPEESKTIISAWADKPHGDDHRPRVVRRLYRKSEDA